MRVIGKLRRRERDERGAISVMVALGMTVLLGSAAIAIDMGHMMNVRTESQRVADLAALAGAAAFVQAPGPNVRTTAETWAKQFALQNTVDKVPVALSNSDIVVDIPNERVRVTVFNTMGRGNAVPTIFARVLGINQVDVVTTAVAEATPAAGVTCVLPLFLVDKWDELGGNSEKYDPGIDYYEPYIASAPTSTYTGWDQSDIGTSLIIKPAQGPSNQSGQPNQSWYFPFDAANLPGGSNYRANIQGCVDPSFVYTIGMKLWVENGAMIGPTRQGFTDLINQDPNAAWNNVMNCITDAVNQVSSDPLHCRSSPRLRPVPMFDPRAAPANGKKQVEVINFAGVFVDRIQSNNVWVIFAGYTGLSPAAPAGGAPPILKTIRLVE